MSALYNGTDIIIVENVPPEAYRPVLLHVTNIQTKRPAERRFGYNLVRGYEELQPLLHIPYPQCNITN